MNNIGTSTVSKILVPSFLLILAFCGLSSLASSGVLIFSSWDTSEKATTEAERISGILEQTATAMEATVNGQPVFRVVVAVDSQEDRSALVQTAKDKNLDTWFLSSKKLAETAIVADATVSDAPDTTPSTGTSEVSGWASEQKIVLSINEADPNAVLEYLDQATINSTISKLDAIRKRAQELIPEFKPRGEEQQSSEQMPDMPQAEETGDGEEGEKPPETSATD